MAVKQKVGVEELEKIIEFNFGVKVDLINDGCYAENPKLIGNVEIYGEPNGEDRFDIEFYTDYYSISTWGRDSEHMCCECVPSVLLYLKRKFGFITNTLFLEIPDKN